MYLELLYLESPININFVAPTYYNSTICFFNKLEFVKVQWLSLIGINLYIYTK